MRNSWKQLNTSLRRMLRVGFGVLACGLVLGAIPATSFGATDTTQFSVASGSLTFSANPNVPDFGTLTLNGQAQTLNAQMANFAVSDATGSGSGYNVTVVGDSGGGKSPVFKQYCSNGGSACGSDAANSYVSGGASLPANSLTLNSTGAGFSGLNGTTGTSPTHSCNSGCALDVASAQKVISAAVGTGMGTFQANTYSSTSLALATPSTISLLPANEIYRVDLVWSLNSGP
jgi:hypothetical protein